MHVDTLRRSVIAMIAAGLIGFGATAPAVAQGLEGAFRVCYATKPRAGAVVMKLDLIVFTPKKTISGEIFMSDAISPPLNRDILAWITGPYVDREKGRHVAGMVTTPTSSARIGITLTTSRNWKAAVARYRIWLNNATNSVADGKVALRQSDCS